MNIKDIAELAGVSKSTVSRYLNNGSVSPKTQRKIREVIDTYSYAPNQFAQSLRAQQTKMIGVIIPRMHSHAVARTVYGIKKTCELQHYQMLLTLTERDTTQELEALRSFQRSKVDGILFMATRITDEHMTIIDSMSMPVVLIGQTHQKLSAIYHDDDQAGRYMAQHIMRNGYQHVYYAGVSETDEAVGHLRYQGLYEHLTQNGIHITTYEAAFDYNVALQRIQHHLPTSVNYAYIGATDTIALALYHVLMQQKPDFMPFIAGFGGDPITEVVYPKIHTIYYQYERAGELAVLQLFKQIIDSDDKDTHILEVLSTREHFLSYNNGTVTN
ncbi:LacI family DNA-binding transcriptional regulator [Staphylococcus sp. 17KM0847]|uniref:LacI family DNA-binding transcriptional regulator n=1 Tax=Staphylococcus sp. 17KM0847 TaxID=2583989 RepID=UPI0015DC1E36|nr:LacI family DNA-binding transcriptional regulator [Staphylococcus sp. 17KM0847]QLK86460.1 LacI family DNA-binding transcriptional regulator [Staphylococcus sp. 17KM0847]